MRERICRALWQLVHSVTLLAPLIRLVRPIPTMIILRHHKSLLAIRISIINWRYLPTNPPLVLSLIHSTLDIARTSTAATQPPTPPRRSTPTPPATLPLPNNLALLLILCEATGTLILRC